MARANIVLSNSFVSVLFFFCVMNFGLALECYQCTIKIDGDDCLTNPEQPNYAVKCPEPNTLEKVLFDLTDPKDKSGSYEIKCIVLKGGNLAQRYGGFIRSCVQVPKLPNVTCNLLKKQDPTIKQCQLCDSDLCNTDTSTP